MLWRALHPADREPFVEGRPRRLEATRWAAEDGPSGPLWIARPAAGGAGEPVVLLHTLGVGPSVFQYGRRAGAGLPTGEVDRSVVGRLTRAGLTACLATTRIDPEAAVPPSSGASRDGRGAVGAFDGVALLDLPAIVDAARAATGARRVHLLGHGWGGLAALAYAAAWGDDAIASLGVLSTPVQFPELSLSRRVVLHALRGLLGGVGRGAPVGALARWLAVWGPPDAVRGAALRGVLYQAAEDVPVGVLDQLAAWCDAGALVDADGVREYGLALRGCRAPLWLGAGPGDPLCPESRARPLAALWGGSVDVHAWDAPRSHLEAVLPMRGRLSGPARGAVDDPIDAWIAWLSEGGPQGARRHRAWSLDASTKSP